MENKFSKIIYFATPYAAIASLLYLFGYWSTFELNILEYVSMSDILRLSIYPMATSLIVAIIGFTVGASIPPHSSKPTNKITIWVTYICLLNCSYSLLQRFAFLANTIWYFIGSCYLPLYFQTKFAR